MANGDQQKKQVSQAVKFMVSMTQGERMLLRCSRALFDEQATAIANVFDPKWKSSITRAKKSETALVKFAVDYLMSVVAEKIGYRLIDGEDINMANSDTEFVKELEALNELVSRNGARFGLLRSEFRATVGLPALSETPSAV